MNSRYNIRTLPKVIVLVLLLFIAVPTATSAKSILYTIPAFGDAWGALAGFTGVVLNHRSVKISPDTSHISYNVKVRNLDTNEIVTEGASVPVGTQLKFEFEPYTYTDISWHGVGQIHDTPYGEWIEGAASPGTACASKDYVTTISAYKSIPYSSAIYISLSVNPPSKSISGLAGLSCDAPESDGSVTCTANEEGNINATFTFDDTYGYFWEQSSSGGGCQVSQYPMTYGGEYNIGYGAVINQYYWAYYDAAAALSWPTYYDAWNNPSGCLVSDGWGYTSVSQQCTDARDTAYQNYQAALQGAYSSPYTLTIPAQTINYPITIGDEDDEDEGANENPPTTPTISALSGSSCTVNEDVVISMSATDPDGDNIRYRIDWNTGGAVYTYEPSLTSDPLYIPSGTATASHSFSTEGEKTIIVYAEDEYGNQSENSESVTVTCVEGDDDSETVYDNDGDDNDGDGGDSSQPADISLKAVPSLVRLGENTRLKWSLSNVASCSIAGSNGDAWNWATIESANSVQTSAINEATTFTLLCTGNDDEEYVDTATVLFVPMWQEF